MDAERDKLVTEAIVATYRMTTQIGPDDYEVTPVCKVITADTTIGELLAWYQLRCPGGKAHFEIVEAS